MFSPAYPDLLKDFCRKWKLYQKLSTWESTNERFKQNFPDYAWCQNVADGSLTVVMVMMALVKNEKFLMMKL